MIGPAHRAAAGTTASPANAICQPGRNCWRIERAHRFSCVQDAADYFRLVRQALLAARRTVFILGWDILATVDLCPGAAPSGAPTRLDELLAFVGRRRPDLRCYILIWDYAALYTLERDPFSRWRLTWGMPRGIRFGFDDRIPVGGSHHQKVIVVDDQLAFCGGIDLTGHRWDTSAHRIDEPQRKSAGEPYEPYHEVQAMVAGPVASSLGVLARDRWRALGHKRLPRLNDVAEDLWPAEVTPDLVDVDVAIARTVPEFETEEAIRECETLFLDTILAAARSIYIESQYFTSDALGEALARRLEERDGPEIVVVSPKECHGWLEQKTMGAFRASVFRRLIAADRHRRLRIVYPAASRARNVPTFIHSKVMVVDDELVRIGSANFSRRSLGVDTECDVAVEAGGDRRVQAGIRQIRNRLLAEHVNLPVNAVAEGIERARSLCAFIDERESAERALVRIDLRAEPEDPPSEALRAAADPEEPILSGALAEQMFPPVDNATPRGPFRMRVFVAAAFAAALVSALLVGRPELRALQDALRAISGTSWTFWTTAAAFLLASAVLVPLELLALAAGILFGPLRGGFLALIGSLVAAAVGYLGGRAIGAGRLRRWMSRRAYRSARQLRVHGPGDVIFLRLTSLASAGSIHLLCGAARVPFRPYVAGTLLGLAPVMFALAGLGSQLRYTLLTPSISNALIALGSAMAVVAVAVVMRTLLLVRRLGPLAASHRTRAEFG
jgi:phosphatidylserine/phosphatidylglycerophosphate/cardiolipin synthase-like enzyme/uncharacterized membrane protein YdjX (TVP38/TMEM64 family)